MWIGGILYFQTAFSQSQLEPQIQTHAKGVKLAVQDSSQVASGVANLITASLKNKNIELRVEKNIQDLKHTRYIHLRQYYKGLPVEGAYLIRRVVNGDTLLDEGKGRIIEDISLDNVVPQIGKDQAIQISILHYDNSKLGTGDVVKKNEPELVIFNNNLAYKVFLNETGADHNEWEFMVDAKGGDILSAHKSLVFRATPPSGSGAAATVQGVSLGSEGSRTYSMTGWRDAIAPQNYFLYYKSGTWGPWGIFSEKTEVNDWVKSLSFNWESTDQFSISAAKNAEWTQQWIHNALGYNSFDNSGTLAEIHTYNTSNEGPRFIVALGKPYIYLTNNFTDASGVSYYQAGALDVVAHEIGHGVTNFAYGPGTDGTYYVTSNYFCGSDPDAHKFYHTSQLAQNESYSDIIGFAVEYASQENNLASYPATSPGTADWLWGEDFVLSPYKAVRDFRYPQRENKSEISQPCCTYYLGTNYLRESGAPSCVGNIPEDEHILACIQDFAFYLLAQGNDQARLNDGHTYGVFSGVGIDIARMIALDADIRILNPWSTFQDARKAWWDAAQNLINQGIAPSNACDAVNTAWKAVGVEPELRFSRAGISYVQVGATNGDLTVRDDIVPMEDINNPAIHNPLKISHNTTGKGFAPTPTLGFVSLVVSGFPSGVGSSLDNENTLVGDLIIRAPNGKVAWAATSDGSLNIRGGLVFFGM